MRVLMVASELFPLVKTGGLADVVGALPRALSRRGHDVRVLVPGYRGVLEAAESPGPPVSLGDPLGVGPTEIIPAKLPGSDTRVYVLRCPSLYDRQGGPYVDPNGHDWGDNHLRFALLARAATIIAVAGAPLGWAPQVVHAHDWQAGLLPAYLQLWGRTRPATVMTVHNLHFAGRFHPALTSAVGLPQSLFSVNGAELYGVMSYLKAGLYFADRITTVSPTYAGEIQTDAHGEGLQGLLSARAPHLHGIINGIDDEVWNPATDPALPAPYDANQIAGKAQAKRELQEKLGMRVDPSIPMFGLVSRLTGQKGIDLVLGNLPLVIDSGAQLVVLGSGAAAYELALSEARRHHPQQIGFYRGYHEPLSHKVMAGSDFVLVPSRFEPCGLTQMYAQRYGSLPIVRHTGGLADTVTDSWAVPSVGTGFSFVDPTNWALGNAMWRGLQTYGTPRYDELQQRAMHRDFGWGPSAKRYEQVYVDALVGPVHLV
ncbi:MAG: glycogen synthase GlgA [Deltaproteobacteria bacterium]|nr:glycogen synthase GlgA [Deltaproteobacteria bacterium]